MAQETFEPGDVVVLKNNHSMKYTFLSDDGDGNATVLNLVAAKDKIPVVALTKLEPPKINIRKI